MTIQSLLFSHFFTFVGCQGQYGDDCLYPCPRNCLNGKCDKYTGQCLSCFPRYYGQLCTNGLFSINDTILNLPLYDIFENWTIITSTLCKKYDTHFTTWLNYLYHSHYTVKQPLFYILLIWSQTILSKNIRSNNTSICLTPNVLWNSWICILFQFSKIASFV